MLVREYREYRRQEILDLYASAGWTNYTKDPVMLERAFEHSLCVFAAYEKDRLIGILRAVGDGQSIVFIQDILVLPEFRRRGAGTMLMRAVAEKYADVYQMQLLTDSTENTIVFYSSLGFSPAGDLGCTAFVRMKP